MVKDKKIENFHNLYITQDYAEAIQQECHTLTKAMKNATVLGLDSKVIDRHIFVNEEKFTCGTIPEH